MLTKVAVFVAFGLLLLACASTDSTATQDSTTTAAPTTSTAETTTTTVAEPEATTTTTTAAPETTTTVAEPDTTTTTTTAAPETTTTVAEPEPTTTTAAPETTTVAPAVPAGVQFGAEIFEISGPIAQRMQLSFREGCPVPLEQLRLITLTHWNFQNEVASGEIVVNADHADDVVQVFSRLFDAGFPIERIELVDNFQADDNLSMAANNTSGFNCREVASSPGVWSNHAFGTAIDINPLQNPYLRGDVVLPPGGAEFVDRSVQVTGGIYSGDAVTAAFAEIGWGWGGDWRTVKDWQHFSADGR